MYVHNQEAYSHLLKSITINKIVGTFFTYTYPFYLLQKCIYLLNSQWLLFLPSSYSSSSLFHHIMQYSIVTITHTAIIKFFFYAIRKMCLELSLSFFTVPLNLKAFTIIQTFNPFSFIPSLSANLPSSWNRCDEGENISRYVHEILCRLEITRG